MPHSMLSGKILNAEDVINKLARLDPRGADAVRKAINETAINIQRKAKRACPVDTGRLRSSINMTFADAAMVATVGTNVDYAPYVEFGTSKQKAQPFLFPAFEEERPQIPPRIAKYFGS